MNENSSKKNGAAAYQWYPGHMTKARRQMAEDIKLVDLVIELLDARIPLSSKNPDIDVLAKGKSRLIILNKSDLADEGTNRDWAQYFKDMGFETVFLDSRSRRDMKRIESAVRKACEKKLARDKSRGIIGRPVRAMVAGIPNVGKSTFINSYAGRACAKTGNKPGVTKGKQWIKLSKTLELLDTPGILWPKFEDESVGRNLALTGSINDEILPREELCVELIRLLKERYPGLVEQHYGIDGGMEATLEQIAISRGAIAKGGIADEKKAARILLDDFRAGRLGRISLEKPEGDPSAMPAKLAIASGSQGVMSS